MLLIGLALRGCLLPTEAGGNDVLVDEWVFRELLDSLLQAISIMWVGVHVTGDDKEGILLQTTGLSLVIYQVVALCWCDVVG